MSHKVPFSTERFFAAFRFIGTSVVPFVLEVRIDHSIEQHHHHKSDESE
jgi:hypothetical protein